MKIMKIIIIKKIIIMLTNDINCIKIKYLLLKKLNDFIYKY